MDEFEQQEWVKFGVAAMLSRQYAADQRTFLERLSGWTDECLHSVGRSVSMGSGGFP